MVSNKENDILQYYQYFQYFFLSEITRQNILKVPQAEGLYAV